MKLKGLKPISIMRYVYPDRSAPLRFGFSQSARNFISTFINDPPTLDAETLKIIASSKIGYLPSRNEKASNAMLALCAGELYFWYWLVRGDGFDVTMWIVSDYLRVLNSIPEEEYELISALGYHLNEHRFEALAFKKNAGKYVGNYCYRKFNRITRRSDLLLLMSLGFSLSHAADIIAYVQKVLSINESAGEKSIPSAVKAMFIAVPVKNKNEQALFRRIDDKLCRFFKLSDDQLSSLINSDIENAFIDYDE